MVPDALRAIARWSGGARSLEPLPVEEPPVRVEEAGKDRDDPILFTR